MGSENLRDQIKQQLKQATLQQTKIKLLTLRLISAALKDQDIAARGEGRDPISDSEVLGLLAKMVKQRKEAANIYDQAGRQEMAEQERQEIAIINEFLPPVLDASATQAAIDQVFEQTGAQSLRDMGKIMTELKRRYPGQMDFGAASKTVKDRLAAK